MTVKNYSPIGAMTVKNYSPNDLRFLLVENMAKYPQCYFVSLQLHFIHSFNSFNSLCSYTVFLYEIFLYFNYASTFNSRICENYITGF